MLKKLWSEWKVTGKYIGDFQSRLLLSLFYFTILAPFGLLARFFDQSLDLRFHQPKQTGWVKRPAVQDSLDEARRHF